MMFSRAAKTGDIIMSEGALWLVWHIENFAGHWLLPIEPAPETIRRHDVTIEGWALMARMGIGGNPVIRPFAMVHKHFLPRSYVRMAMLDDGMMEGCGIAVAREMRDRAIERKWAQWAPTSNQPANVWAN